MYNCLNDRRYIMLAKSWKKICLIILIVACLISIIAKLTNIISFDAAIEGIKNQIQSIQIK